MQLFHGESVRRFVGLAVILFFSLPFGLSVAGCGHKTAPVQYCNAGDSGPVVGQVSSISLSPTLATVGESLNYAQIGQGLNASAVDCKGNAVSVKSYVYASTSSYSVNTTGGSVFADINPSNGQVCGGTWNRNTGGGIPDYTTCTAPTIPPVQTVVVVNPVISAPPALATSGTGTGATIVLAPARSTDPLSGNLVLTSGAGNYSVTLPTGSTIATLATLINASGSGFTAVANSTLVITGPVPPAGATSLTPYVVSTTGTKISDNTQAYVAYVTATANGAVSNAIPVYVHPIVTGIVLGGATAIGSCPSSTNPAGNDPGTDCCPNSTVGTPIVAPVYTGTGCVSQNKQAQLIARIYQGGTTSAANNITCQVGHVTYNPVSGSGIVTIDQNGVATANQPGSTLITATLSNSGSSTQAGFFSTCPPASISLAIPGSTATSINVNLNNSQPLVATVTDTAGNVVTGLNLEYNSSSQQNIPANSSSITPVYPGSAVITAVCQPANCNPAPFSQIGLSGNGEPLTSNGITITSTGTSSTVLYMASAADSRTGSAGSQYLVPYDFTINQPSSPIKLSFVPNSMLMNLAGTTIYLGSSEGLMTVSTASNAASGVNTGVPGVVLSISPDGTMLVVTDPIRQTISIVSATSGAVLSTYGGVGTASQWTPDSETAYITTQTSTSYPNPTLLQYSLFTKWQAISTPSETYTSVAVTVPNVGAYFSGAAETDGRSYCTVGTQTSPGPPPVISNQFVPLADSKAFADDVLAATDNGSHILGAHVVAGAGNSVLNDLEVSLPVTTPCPPPGATAVTPFTSSRFFRALTGVTATAVTGVFPSTNSVVAPVTYIGSGSVLPVYYPTTTGIGNLINVPLVNGATAPISGVFSTDGLTFYAGTLGDNAVHLITFTYPTGGGVPTATDSATPLMPDLPAYGGTGSMFAPVNLLAQYPKKSKG